jgi:hypothetical protein
MHKGASGQVEKQLPSPVDRQLMELVVRYVLNGLQVLLPLFQVNQQNYPPSSSPEDPHLFHLHGA